MVEIETLRSLLGLLIANERLGIERHGRTSVYVDRVRDNTSRIAAFEEVARLLDRIEANEPIDLHLYPQLDPRLG